MSGTVRFYGEQSGRGPMIDNLVEVSDQVIDPGRLITAVSAPAVGAVVLFLGTVRDHSAGRTGVTHLEYEAYGDLVEGKIAEIVAETRLKWPTILGIAAAHRTGELEVGETSVAVAVSASHRIDAFPAGQFVIDELKKRAPIWKKEHWPGGAEWVREDHHHS